MNWRRLVNIIKSVEVYKNMFYLLFMISYIVVNVYKCINFISWSLMCLIVIILFIVVFIEINNIIVF